MATDEQQMLTDICDAIVSEGGYHFAWYGRACDDGSRTVEPIAWAGYEAGYLSEMRFSWDEDDPAGRGPTGRAIRSGEIHFAHLVASHPGMDVWREAALQRGYVSTVALPVLVDGVVDGALMVYATEPTAFDATEIGLLGDLALGIGTGLSRLADIRALEASALQAEASSRRLRATLDSLIDPFVLLEAVRDENGTIVDFLHVEANEAATHYTGRDRDSFLGTSLMALYPGLRDIGLVTAYVDVVETGRPMILDSVEYAPRSHLAPHRYDLRGVRCGDGLALTWRDVTRRHSAQQRIADSERRYRLLAENATDIVSLLDVDRRVVWVSPSVTAATGWLPDELEGRGFDELVHQDDLTALLQEMSGAGPHASVFRLRRTDGVYSWMSATGRWAADDDGSRLGYVVALRDIDIQVRAQRELAEREERYRMLSENASDVVLKLGADGRIVWASESITTVLGWSGRDILGRVAADLVHPDDRAMAVEGRLVDAAHGSTSARLRLLRADGEPQWMAVTEHHVNTDDGDFRVIALRDIDDAVRAQVELEHAIGHDPLTGLATRATTLSRLRHLVERLPAEDSTVGVLFVGVDGLSSVNEALTHEAGDKVLAIVASRITSAAGDVDVVGRGGGDEFVVLLPRLASAADAALMAERVRLSVHGEVTVGVHRIEPTVSIGIATGERRSDPESLLRDASLAMRQAKAHGRRRGSRRRARPDVPADRPARRRLPLRLRGARPVGALRRDDGGAQRVPAGRRADDAHHRDRPGHPASIHRRAAYAPVAPHHRRQRLGCEPRPARLRRPGHRRPARIGHRPDPAAPRGHGDRRPQGHRAGADDDGSAGRRGAALVHGRLRHRLLLDQSPARPPDRRHEAGPLVHLGARHRDDDERSRPGSRVRDLGPVGAGARRAGRRSRPRHGR
jgi:diguanylate cyclase (GGDEF)-like protein/PAS domain S-box-containing protein